MMRNGGVKQKGRKVVEVFLADAGVISDRLASHGLASTSGGAVGGQLRSVMAHLSSRGSHNNYTSLELNQSRIMISQHK